MYLPIRIFYGYSIIWFRKTDYQIYHRLYFTPIWEKSVPNRLIYRMKMVNALSETNFQITNFISDGIVIGWLLKMMFIPVGVECKSGKEPFIFVLTHIRAGNICLND